MVIIKIKHILSMSNNYLVVDTPNVLFTRKHKTSDFTSNILAFTKYCGKVKDTVIITVVTPLMKKLLSENLTLLKFFIEVNGGLIVESKNKDPDIVVLNLAKKYQCKILSNDKYKQGKYKDFEEQRKNCIRFKILKQKLLVVS
jgi:hypothetical protein